MITYKVSLDQYHHRKRRILILAARCEELGYKKARRLLLRTAKAKYPPTTV